MSLWRTGAILSTTAILMGGCASEFTAPGVMEQARSTTPGSDPLAAALYQDYMMNAEYEFDDMEDSPDAIFHAEKAMAGAQGQSVQPQMVSERDIPQEFVGELNQARTRLTTALGGGNMTDKPDASAQALASYDCWLEQQEENFQPGDIAACKEHFYAALAVLEEQPEAVVVAPPPQPLPELISLASDVLFEFDKSAINRSFEPELAKIANLIAQNPGTPVGVLGHTDATGPEQYNQGLSERRAQSVADYLVGQGVDQSRLRVQGFGESEPVASNDTREGRSQNRRVDIVTTVTE